MAIRFLKSILARLYAAIKLQFCSYIHFMMNFYVVITEMNDFPREILPWYRLILFEQTPQLHKYLSSYSWKEIIFPFYLRLKCLDHIFFLSPQQAYTATARLHVILKWFWLQSLNDCGLWETHKFFFI